MQRQLTRTSLGFLSLIRSHLSSSSSVDLAGVFPPIVTPFDNNEDLYLDKLRFNVGMWKNKNFRGYTVLGSNGEFQYLTIEEKVRIVETVKNEDPAKTIIVGAGHESTKLTKKYVSLLAEAGGDLALIYTPCFYRGSMSPSAFIHHFTAIADESPIPIILYNVPGNTGLDLPIECVITLAEHDNIVGIKESGGNVVRIGSIAHRTKHLDFQILAGSASFMISSYSVGAVGTVAALANVMGDEVCQLHDSINAKMDCLGLQHKLIAPNTAVTATFGVAGLKFVCDNVGLYGGPSRSPILPLNDLQKGKLSSIMAEVVYLGNMGCGGCCRYFPCLRFTIGILTFLAFLMGILSFMAPAWLERDILADPRDAAMTEYKTYAYGVLSSGGVQKIYETVNGVKTATVKETKYVWQFNDNWNQWTKLEDQTVMIVYAVGMLFILISLWNIAITECVPIKNQSTMLIMMVVWDILAALCIGAAVIMYCATWHNNETLKDFCKNTGDGTEFKAFSLGICKLSWALYGAVATACVVIFVTGLNIIAAYQAKSQRRDAAFRHM
ncbi:hypothetical protein ACHWQZ_G007592 [Mnemiopsis leidyi]